MYVSIIASYNSFSGNIINIPAVDRSIYLEELERVYTQ